MTIIEADERGDPADLGSRTVAKALERRCERVGCRHLDIRLHTYAFPVRVRDRVDRARVRHGDDEVVPDRTWSNGVRASPGDLANDGGPLLRLEVVRELLRAREGVRRRQNEYRLPSAEAAARHAIARPEFLGLTGPPIPDIVEMRAPGEQVRRHVAHHRGRSEEHTSELQSRFGT